MSDHDPNDYYSQWAHKKSNLKPHERAKVDSQERRTDADAGKPEEDVYYRKLSQGEYKSMMQISRINMAAALEYVDTINYRYWLSTSLVKVRQFENEKAADSAGVIVKFKFKQGFSRALLKLLKPHQMSGVQHSNEVVAYHREGFLQLGNVTTMQEMLGLLEQNKHHNVGFTQKQADLLQNSIERVDTVT